MITRMYTSERTVLTFFYTKRNHYYCNDVMLVMILVRYVIFVTYTLLTYMYPFTFLSFPLCCSDRLIHSNPEETYYNRKAT